MLGDFTVKKQNWEEKYHFFTKWTQISLTQKNRNFISINWELMDQQLFPYKSYGMDMSETYFFIFLAVVSP